MDCPPHYLKITARFPRRNFNRVFLRIFHGTSNTPHWFFNRDDQARLEPIEDSMSDPRYTDPRYEDPRLDTGFPQGDSISGPLGWIVGIAAVVLIAFVVFVGIKQGTHPANDKPLATTGVAPSTTGFGGSSPQPMSPPTRSEEPLPP